MKKDLIESGVRRYRASGAAPVDFDHLLAGGGATSSSSSGAGRKSESSASAWGRKSESSSSGKIPLLENEKSRRASCSASPPRGGHRGSTSFGSSTSTPGVQEPHQAAKGVQKRLRKAATSGDLLGPKGTITATQQPQEVDPGGALDPLDLLTNPSPAASKGEPSGREDQITRDESSSKEKDFEEKRGTVPVALSPKSPRSDGTSPLRSAPEESPRSRRSLVVASEESPRSRRSLVQNRKNSGWLGRLQNSGWLVDGKTAGVGKIGLASASQTLKRRLSELHIGTTASQQENYRLGQKGKATVEEDARYDYKEEAHCGTLVL